MFLAFGIAALLVALALVGVLLRLGRTLAAIEEMVVLGTSEMRQVLPEVRESLGNVNDITAGVNVAIHAAGTGVEDLGGRLQSGLRGRAADARAWSHGVAVAARSLWHSVSAATPGE